MQRFLKKPYWILFLNSAIEAPCPALAGLKRDRESSKCKEVIPFYCSSLANPAAPKAGSPLRYDKLRGMRSLEHFELAKGAIGPLVTSQLWFVLEI